jgi:hypothetical protein
MSFALAHDPLTPLDPNVQPSAVAIRLLQRELYNNVRCIDAAAGGGMHGHLGMLMPEAEYVALAGAGNEYELPERPDVPDMHDLTPAQRAEAVEDYKDDVRLYNEATSLHNYIKKLMVAAIPKVYLDSLEDEVHELATVTARTILAHMVTSYGTVTAEDLDANLKLLSAPWDIITPIETLFAKGNKCRQLATAGGDPITDAFYMRTLRTVFHDTGVFAQAIHEWDAKPAAAKTVANFCTHFLAADKERRFTDKTAKSVLTANSAQTKPTPNVATGPATHYYCWTHGLGVNASHTSATCTKPAPGHNKAATLDDMKGGNNTIRRRQGKKPIYTAPKRTNPKAAVAKTEAAEPKTE